MERGRLKRSTVVGVAGLVLAVLIAQIAVAGGSDDGKVAGLQHRVNQNERQINTLKAQVASLASARVAKKKRKHGTSGPQGPPGSPGAQGPPGPQGPAGGAPACQGNGSGDTMVAAGSVCIDRYEDSVWSSPTGGTQYGVSSDDYPCNNNGQDCTNIYARSVPGVPPSTWITWFQAQQALANVGKRLPTNAEWQQAVAGTPDSTACNVFTMLSDDTGANSGCVSRFGVNDMVGNVSEWVADWVPASTASPGWGAFSDDSMGLSGASTAAQSPGALVRGGNFGSGPAAGPFFVVTGSPTASPDFLGFRGAR